MAATSAEAVSLVGRAALALGNAVVDGIEGTADFVQHAAKQAAPLCLHGSFRIGVLISVHIDHPRQ